MYRQSNVPIATTTITATNAGIGMRATNRKGIGDGPLVLGEDRLLDDAEGVLAAVVQALVPIVHLALVPLHAGGQRVARERQGEFGIEHRILDFRFAAIDVGLVGRGQARTRGLLARQGDVR